MGAPASLHVGSALPAHFNLSSDTAELAHLADIQQLRCSPALADVSGESTIVRLHFHPPTGGIAVATALRGRESEALHARVPLLHLVDGADPAGAPMRTPIHTGGCLWSAAAAAARLQPLRGWQARRRTWCCSVTLHGEELPPLVFLLLLLLQA